jgi:predicted RNA-binding Zn ribbon-like protein
MPPSKWLSVVISHGDAVVGYLMTSERMALANLRLLGGALCLDFVNSIENRTGHAPEDFLTSYPDLVRWAQHAGLIDDATARRLITRAAADEPAALEALHQALALRSALHHLLFAVATGRDPNPADLDQLQRVYTDATSGATLVPAGKRFAWEWRSDEQRLDQLLWPVARSAVELLTTGDRRRIKVCENPYGCGWLFYDGSKNGSRRWCSMGGCGSQVKMRRQYAKRRAAAGANSG